MITSGALTRERIVDEIAERFHVGLGLDPLARDTAAGEAADAILALRDAGAEAKCRHCQCPEGECSLRAQVHALTEERDGLEIDLKNERVTSDSLSRKAHDRDCENVALRTRVETAERARDEARELFIQIIGQANADSLPGVVSLAKRGRDALTPTKAPPSARARCVAMSTDREPSAEMLELAARVLLPSRPAGFDRRALQTESRIIRAVALLLDDALADAHALIERKDAALRDFVEHAGAAERLPHPYLDGAGWEAHVRREYADKLRAALALTPAALRAQQAVERAVIEAAKLVVNQIICMGGDHKDCNPCQNRDRLARALADLAALPGPKEVA